MANDASRLHRRLRRVALVLLGLIIVEYLVLPQIAGARQAIDLLGKVNPAWLLAGVGLEALAIVAYAQLTRSLIPPEERPSLWSTVRMTLSTLGVSHVVPGGTAVGASLGYRLLTEADVRPTDAGFALATQGLGSAVVLNALLWLGLVVSIPLRGFNPLYLTAAGLGALLLGGLAIAVLMLTRGEERAARVICSAAEHIPFVNGDAVSRTLSRVATRLRELAADRRLLARSTGWASLNWLLDAASLWVFLAAFGHRIGPDGLLVAYGLANVLAAIPVTPGGLGVVEAVLTSMLVAFGAPRGEAILGVISYRLVNFWLPIPLGGLAYVSLRVDRVMSRRARAAELRDAAEEALEIALDRSARRAT
jgi:uncharacterized protein (TIRG00374 family)